MSNQSFSNNNFDSRYWALKSTEDQVLQLEIASATRPISQTQYAIARWDDPNVPGPGDSAGAMLNSTVLLDDNDNVSGVNSITFDGEASNPGGNQTVWVNSSDSNNLYYGSIPLSVGGGLGITETTVLNITFSGNTTGPIGAPATSAYLVKVGSMVTISIESYFGDLGTNQEIFSAGLTIPADFRPTVDRYGLYRVVEVGVETPDVGSVIISSGGTIRVARIDFGGVTPNWSPGAGSGWDYINFSYKV